jgi:ADP-ribose pyrophosphatase YjhB (NUDIX family)
MKYCSSCGAPVVVRVPEGDNRPRHVCDACGVVHYQNPKIVAGCIAEWEDRVLLCRRGIEPRYGYWTLPAGFLENGESVYAGAERETLEEAHARVRVTQLFADFSLPHINQVYMLYRGTLLDLDFGPGHESIDVRLFAEGEIPWGQLAFPVIREALQLYFRARREGGYRNHTGEILRQGAGPFGSYRVTLL